jgi:alpha-1,6-mannosyltransferase
MNNKLLFRISQSVLIASFLLDLLLCPHSKVEESFQLQATHDLFYHGVQPAISHFFGDVKNEGLPYDHLQYPGGTILN